MRLTAVVAVHNIIHLHPRKRDDFKITVLGLRGNMSKTLFCLKRSLPRPFYSQILWIFREIRHSNSTVVF